MESGENHRKHLPPYVSYRTFRNFLERLQQHIPSRIDRSYWGDFLSGSNGVQLMAALKFLKLVDVNGKPSDRLKAFTASRGEHRAEILRQLANDAYPFVNKNNLDLGSATYAQLQESFHDAFQLTEDVSRKCVKFYISMANDAGISISPYIARHTRSPGTGQRTKKISAIIDKGTNRSQRIPQGQDNVPANRSWDAMLLAKFPNFDPAWNDDIKMKWFSAFDELLKRGNNGG